MKGPELSGHSPGSFRVALVNLPLGPIRMPSIQLGLLHSVLLDAGFAVDSHHLNMDLAAVLSPAVYDELAGQERMTGEWLFSVSAFGDAAPDEESFFTAFPAVFESLSALGKDKSFPVQLRRRILPDFIDDCVWKVDWQRYSVVGFSTTHQQTVASLALALRIKGIHPAVQIVFGGQNVDGEMGKAHAEAFPLIDYVIAGEGEVAFPRLLRQLAGWDPVCPIEGVFRRAGERVEGYGRAEPVPHLDALPVPDYRDYFDRARALGVFEPSREVSLPFQSSRGCWWGEKSQCTFCGLNGPSLRHRHKSAAAVLRELAALAGAYQVTQFWAVDTILPARYLSVLFPALAASRDGYRLRCDIRANLTKKQIRTLHEGGVRWVVPGIESMSSRLLALMNKGCTMLQNVYTLKWCRHYGIAAGWNLLRGFPGETAEDYRKQLEILKLIPHLEPPAAWKRFWLDRFSLYFLDRTAYPVRNVRAEASYRYVYPDGLDVFGLARIFDCEMDDTLPESAHAETEAWIQEWRERWRSGIRPALLYRRNAGGIIIEDYRDARVARRYPLAGPLALVYQFCSDAIRSERQVRELAGDDAAEALSEFCELGLMLGEDSDYLSLALPADADG